ncbi:esterase/lipase family protein [Nocardioides sp. CPCC 205120]|uniref:esterase/lipase family protein n=1 Tax=Nocardioides sp. CPCC 205120 TaxID=3406462 RepID=UPI003B50B6B5
MTVPSPDPASVTGAERLPAGPRLGRSPLAAQRAAAASREPTVLDALALLLEVADELVVRGARDTHRAVADRAQGLAARLTLGAADGPRLLHDGIAGGVYGGIGAGLRAAARGTTALAAGGRGPAIEAHPAGRHLRAAVNGLIGDRLAAEDRRMAIPLAVRVDGRDVEPTRPALAAAYPDAEPRVAVLLHGLGESEAIWTLGREARGTTYPEELAAAGWTPVLLRMNTGLGLRVNGVALSALLARLVEGWPVPVERVALVGHSMGGLVVRAASAVRTAGAEGAAGAAGAGDAPGSRDWTERVTDVVTLGTPHRGAPLAGLVGDGSSLLGGLAETGAFGRVLDERSVGIRDLVEGLGHDVPLLPHARYRLVSATLTRSPRHPLGRLVGDLLVREHSAYGRRRGADDVFADADVETLHVGGVDHFALVNHPDVARALARWLA